MILVTWNLKITKVVWRPSQWSITCQKNGLSMLASYYCFLGINTAINIRKWTIFRVWGQALTLASISTIRYQLQDIKPSTKNAMFTNIPQDSLTGYSYYVMVVTWNQWIIKVVWPPSQCSETGQNEAGISMLTSYFCCFFDNWKNGTIENFIC